MNQGSEVKYLYFPAQVSEVIRKYYNILIE